MALIILLTAILALALLIWIGLVHGWIAVLVQLASWTLGAYIACVIGNLMGRHFVRKTYGEEIYIQLKKKYSIWKFWD